MNCEICGRELIGDFAKPLCFRCKGVSYGKVPGGAQSGNSAAPAKADPAWERGVAGEYRSDGSFVPYLTMQGGAGDVMHVKEYAENRHKIEAIRDRHRNDPSFFADMKGS